MRAVTLSGSTLLWDQPNVYQTYLVIYCLFIGSIWDPGLLYSLGYYFILGLRCYKLLFIYLRSLFEFLVVRVSVLAF